MLSEADKKELIIVGLKEQAKIFKKQIEDKDNLIFILNSQLKDLNSLIDTYLRSLDND